MYSVGLAVVGLDLAVAIGSPKPQNPILNEKII
jgi:hypothetical protein